MVTTGLTGTPAETPVENMAEIMQTVMGKNPESWSDKARGGGLLGKQGWRRVTLIVIKTPEKKVEQYKQKYEETKKEQGKRYHTFTSLAPAKEAVASSANAAYDGNMVSA